MKTALLAHGVGSSIPQGPFIFIFFFLFKPLCASPGGGFGMRGCIWEGCLQSAPTLDAAPWPRAALAGGLQAGSWESR